MDRRCRRGKPPALFAAEIAATKNASTSGTNDGKICFTAVRFFHDLGEMWSSSSSGSIDLMRESRKGKLAGDIILVEGHVLVASTTERDVKGGDKKDVGANTPSSGVKSGAGRKRRPPTPKDESHVSNALRSVYQRAVDEAIPSEMLDLLRKLD